MPITVKKINEYLNFGSCLEISNGDVELLVTLDIGPRIIRYGMVGGTNVMYNDVDRELVDDSESFSKTFYPGAKWQLFGGHRLWVAPEKFPNTYYPDCNPVNCHILENGAIFIPNEQVENGVQLKIKAVMSEDGKVEVTHYVTNISNNEKALSPWAISVLNKGGLEIIPQNTLNTGLLPNRRVIMWPYSNMADSRVYFGKKYITLKQDPEATTAFKLGLDNLSGYALYAIMDSVFVKKYIHDTQACYEDFGSSFETYTDGNILEMETLGVKSVLKPGETATHIEKWAVFENTGTPEYNDEEQIDAFVKQYINF